jgi:hypothetical protein
MYSISPTKRVAIYDKQRGKAIEKYHYVANLNVKTTV